jgi:hypothetical protein
VHPVITTKTLIAIQAARLGTRITLIRIKVTGNNKVVNRIKIIERTRANKNLIKNFGNMP